MTAPSEESVARFYDERRTTGEGRKDSVLARPV
jgi:hypothetical protein